MIQPERGQCLIISFGQQQRRARLWRKNAIGAACDQAFAQTERADNLCGEW